MGVASLVHRSRDFFKRRYLCNVTGYGYAVSTIVFRIANTFRLTTFYIVAHLISRFKKCLLQVVFHFSNFWTIIKQPSRQATSPSFGYVRDTIGVYNIYEFRKFWRPSLIRKSTQCISQFSLEIWITQKLYQIWKIWMLIWNPRVRYSLGLWIFRTSKCV